MLPAGCASNRNLLGVRTIDDGSPAWPFTALQHSNRESSPDTHPAKARLPSNPVSPNNARAGQDTLPPGGPAGSMPGLIRGNLAPSLLFFACLTFPFTCPGAWPPCCPAAASTGPRFRFSISTPRSRD